MGVYIEGMEMPKDRPQLLWIYPNGKALPVQSDVDPWKELQAVPVPPHGDLIDRDKLRAKEFIHDGDAYAVVMSRDIRNAPTIIPASVTEE